MPLSKASNTPYPDKGQLDPQIRLVETAKTWQNQFDRKTEKLKKPGGKNRENLEKPHEIHPRKDE